MDGAVELSPAGRWRPPGRLLLGTGAGYLAGALLAWTILEAAETSAVFYASAGVTSAALLLSRPAHWPWVLGLVACIEFTVDAAHGWPVRFALLLALANTAEPLLGAVLLRRYTRRPDLTRRLHVAAFAACCVLAGPMLGALIGTTAVIAAGRGDWADVFFPFWAGDALGVLTIGSAILAWRTGRRTGTGPARRERAWTAGAALATAAVTVAGFWPLVVPLLFLPMPLLFWVAVRAGVPALTTCGAALAVTANTMSAAGRGPWRPLSDSPQLAAATLQLFIAVAVLGAWALAVTASDRERARSRARTDSAARRQLEALQTATVRLYEREREAAHRLQTALVPVLDGRLPGVVAAGGYRPAEATHDVGGDWYDAFALADGRIAFAVGDVVGHDLDAAVTMGRLQAAVRLMARTYDAPDAVLRGLDAATTDIPGALCASLGYGDYHPGTRTLRYLCAGHPPPLLIEPDQVCYLEHGRGAPLGVRTPSGRRHAQIRVPAAATLVWYTDGLVERRTENLDAGLRRLAESAGQLRDIEAPTAVRDHLIRALAGDGPLADDVAVLCLRFP